MYLLGRYIILNAVISTIKGTPILCELCPQLVRYLMFSPDQSNPLMLDAVLSGIYRLKPFHIRRLPASDVKRLPQDFNRVMSHFCSVDNL